MGVSDLLSHQRSFFDLGGGEIRFRFKVSAILNTHSSLCLDVCFNVPTELYIYMYSVAV